MIRKLNKKDKLTFFDFAINKKINIYDFKKFVTQEKMAFVSDIGTKFNGIVYIEKRDKRFVNLITNSKKVANQLLKVLFWNCNQELFAEIYEKDKTGFILKENGFRIIDKKNDIFILNYNPKFKRNYHGSSNNR